MRGIHVPFRLGGSHTCSFHTSLCCMQYILYLPKVDAGYLNSLTERPIYSGCILLNTV